MNTPSDDHTLQFWLRWALGFLCLAHGTTTVNALFGFPLATQVGYGWQEIATIETAAPGEEAAEPKVYDGSQCDRVCVAGEPPRICHYHWVLENYAAMGSACRHCFRGQRDQCFHPQCVTASGMERGIVTINRRIPGPAIHVCKHDIIAVDVHNSLEGMESAIHWHGFHQGASPWMDGVPMVSQCPIPAATTFRYQFVASEPGTQFYHSHSGFHKANGHYGIAVVRDPDDLNRHLYDHDLSEHYLIVSDWTESLAEKWVPGLPTNEMFVSSVLINGRGRFFNNTSGQHKDVPLSVYRVQYGKRYRFRLVSSGSQYCPFQLQIESHTMQIIATDGSTVRPNHTVDTLISISGERYDFVLAANQRPRNYWIRVRGIGFCNSMRVETFAVLTYADAAEPLESFAFPSKQLPPYDEPYRTGVVLNEQTAQCYVPGDDYLCAADLESYDQYRDDELIEATPHQHLYIGFNVMPANNSLLFSPNGFHHFVTVSPTFNTFGTTNNISLVTPSFPLMVQPELIADERVQFCNASHLPAGCTADRVCFCTHRLSVRLNSIVEVVLYDTARASQEFYHPFHLHGHRFIVTDMGKFPVHAEDRRIEYLQRMRRVRRPNGLNPPFKDTMSVPNKGYVRTRLRADNAGFWLVHCHFEWHLGAGMGLVLQVGEVDQMLKAPANFPKCSDYKPRLKGLR